MEARTAGASVAGAADIIIHMSAIFRMWRSFVLNATATLAKNAIPLKIAIRYSGISEVIYYMETFFTIVHTHFLVLHATFTLRKSLYRRSVSEAPSSAP